jgi:hypothetical protein
MIIRWGTRALYVEEIVVEKSSTCCTYRCGIECTLDSAKPMATIVERSRRRTPKRARRRACECEVTISNCSQRILARSIQMVKKMHSCAFDISKQPSWGNRHRTPLGPEFLGFLPSKRLE